MLELSIWFFFFQNVKSAVSSIFKFVSQYGKDLGNYEILVNK